jgi:PPOX class probable F420-dependent enzyme
MAPVWPDDFHDLLDSPAPAVLTTYRRDDTATGTPVWFRFAGGAFEVVIRKGDVKHRHLQRRPECALVVFETVRPFRGVEVRGQAELREIDVTQNRLAIVSKYLGADDADRFAAARDPVAILVRLPGDQARAWDLSEMLPPSGA